jgi:hypothetical protein
MGILDRAGNKTSENRSGCDSLARGAGGRPVRARAGAAAEKGGELARLAGQLCNAADFQRFVAARHGEGSEGVHPRQHAAEFVRDRCGVNSRARLDHDAEAAVAFHEKVRRPYLAWKERHHG